MYVQDPVAIPYLLRAARIEPVASGEVEALVRIGGMEARKALEELARSPREWTAQLAQGALKRIK